MTLAHIEMQILKHNINKPMCINRWSAWRSFLWRLKRIRELLKYLIVVMQSCCIIFLSLFFCPISDLYLVIRVDVIYFNVSKIPLFK